MDTYVYIITVNGVDAGPNQSVCAGTAVTLTGAGSQNCTWNNGVVNGVPFIPLTTQTYTLTGTNTNSCAGIWNGTDQVTVTVNPLPTVSAGNNQSVCAGSSVTLSGSGASSYTWSNGVQNGVPFTPNATQTYTVTGTDANGCSNTAQVTVTVNPSPNVSGGNNQSICIGSPVTLSGSGAINYSWNNGVVNGTTFTPLATQTYTVTGTNANGCSNTAQVTVTVNPLPTVSAGSNQSVCVGTPVTLIGSGANTYSWTNGVANATPFIPMGTQIYTVTGTNANGCSNTAHVTVTVNPSPNVSAGSNQSVCAGSPVTLSGSGASSYTWSNGISNGVPFVPIATQMYTVTGTANGCSNTAQVTVTVNPIPNISAGADQSICSGDPVTLNGSGGSTYQWNNNVVNGQAFTPNQSANYVLNGTDSLGCQGTDTVVVTVLENATSTLTQTALDSYTLNGQTYTQSGTYTQTVPAANGCDSTITLNLTLNFTGIYELGTGAKKLVKITDLNGKNIPRRKNTLMLFIYEDGTVERVLEMEE
jgi:hypothetical protein